LIGQFVPHFTFCPETAAAHNCTYSDNTQESTMTQSNGLCTIFLFFWRDKREWRENSTLTPRRPGVQREWHQLYFYLVLFCSHREKKKPLSYRFSL